MKFLQLTKKFPYPPYDGESLLISDFNNILSKKINKLDILSFNTIKHYFDISTYPDEKNPYNRIYDIYLDNRLKVSKAFLNLFSTIPYNISRFIDEKFEAKLKEILSKNDYDFILMESIFLLPYIETIRKNSKARIILRSHNVEYEIWERISKSSFNIPLKIYTGYLAKKLKKYELSNIGKTDILITLTERDLKKYKKHGYKGRTMVVPAGIISDTVPAKLDLTGDLQFSFIGSLDWMPNSEGIKWFVNKVWKQVLEKHSGFALHIAGRNTPEWIFNMQTNGVKVYGEVPDSKDFLNSYPIMIVPLLSGSGMRLKILEALALGRIVITTSIGLEGIEAIDGKHVLIADTPQEFVEKIEFCHSNREALMQISENAIALFKEKYELNKTVDRFLKFIVSTM